MSVATRRSLVRAPSRSSARSAARSPSTVRPRHPTTFRRDQRLLAFDLMSNVWRLASVQHVYHEQWDERRCRVPEGEWLPLENRPKQLRVRFIGWFDADDADILMCDVPYRLRHATAHEAAACDIDLDAELDTRNHNACSNCLEGGAERGGRPPSCCDSCPRIYHPDCLRFIDTLTGSREEEQAQEDGGWVCTWCRRAELRPRMREEFAKNRSKKLCRDGKALMWWDEQREEEELKPPYGPARFFQFVAEEYQRRPEGRGRPARRRWALTGGTRRRRRQPPRQPSQQPQQPQQQQPAEEPEVPPADDTEVQQQQQQQQQEQQQQPVHERPEEEAEDDLPPDAADELAADDVQSADRLVRLAAELGEQLDRQLHNRSHPSQRHPPSVLRQPTRGRARVQNRGRRTADMELRSEDEEDGADHRQRHEEYRDSTDSKVGEQSAAADGELDAAIALFDDSDYMAMSCASDSSDVESRSPTSPLPVMSPHCNERYVNSGTMPLQAVKSENSTKPSQPRRTAPSLHPQPILSYVVETPSTASAASLPVARAASSSSVALPQPLPNDVIVIDDSDDEQQPAIDSLRPVAQLARANLSAAFTPAPASTSSPAISLSSPLPSASTAPSTLRVPRSRPQIRPSASPSLLSSVPLPVVPSSSAPPTHTATVASRPALSGPSAAVARDLVSASAFVPPHTSASSSSSVALPAASSHRPRSSRPASYSQQSGQTVHMRSVRAAGSVHVQSGSLQLSVSPRSANGTGSLRLEVAGLDLSQLDLSRLQVRIGDTVIEMPSLSQHAARSNETGVELGSLQPLSSTLPVQSVQRAEMLPLPAVRPPVLTGPTQPAAAQPSSPLALSAADDKVSDFPADEDTNVQGASAASEGVPSFVQPSSSVPSIQQSSTAAGLCHCCLCDRAFPRARCAPLKSSRLAALGYTRELPYPQHELACDCCRGSLNRGRLPSSLLEGNKDNCAFCNILLPTGHYSRRQVPTAPLQRIGYDRPPPHPNNVYVCLTCFSDICLRERLPSCTDTATSTTDNPSNSETRAEQETLHPQAALSDSSPASSPSSSDSNCTSLSAVREDVIADSTSDKEMKQQVSPIPSLEHSAFTHGRAVRDQSVRPADLTASSPQTASSSAAMELEDEKLDEKDSTQLSNVDVASSDLASSLRSVRLVPQLLLEEDLRHCCLCNGVGFKRRFVARPSSAQLAAAGYTGEVPYPQYDRACKSCWHYFRRGKLPLCLIVAPNTDNCAFCNRTVSTNKPSRVPTAQLTQLGYDRPPPHPNNVHVCRTCFIHICRLKQLPQCVRNIASRTDSPSNAAPRSDYETLHSQADCPAIVAAERLSSSSSSSSSSSPSWPSSSCSSTSASLSTPTAAGPSALPTSSPHSISTSSALSLVEVDMDSATEREMPQSASPGQALSPRRKRVKGGNQSEFIKETEQLAVAGSKRKRPRRRPKWFAGPEEEEKKEDNEEADESDRVSSEEDDDEEGTSSKKQRVAVSQPTAHWQPWTARMDRRLLKLRTAHKLTKAEIGRRMGRTTEAIINRLKTLQKQQASTLGTALPQSTDVQLHEEDKEEQGDTGEKEEGEADGRVWNEQQDQQLLALIKANNREIGRMGISRQAVNSRSVRPEHELTDRQSQGEKEKKDDSSHDKSVGGRSVEWTAERDEQLMAWLSERYSHRSIASTMNVSAQSIKSRVRRLARKTRASVEDSKADDEMKDADMQDAATPRVMARRPWRAEDDAELRRLAREQLPLKMIAERTGRSVPAIKKRLLVVRRKHKAAQNDTEDEDGEEDEHDETGSTSSSQQSEEPPTQLNGAIWDRMSTDGPVPWLLRAYEYRSLKQQLHVQEGKEEKAERNHDVVKQLFLAATPIFNTAHAVFERLRKQSVERSEQKKAEYGHSSTPATRTRATSSTAPMADSLFCVACAARLSVLHCCCLPAVLCAV